MFLLQILTNSVVLAMQVVLIALPLYMIYAVSRVYNLAIAAFATALGYGFLQMYRGTGSVILASLGSIVVALLLSWILYVMVEPFVRRGHELLALLVTFCLSVAIEVLLGLFYGNAGQAIFDTVLPTISIGGILLPYPAVVTIVAGVVFLVLLFLLLQGTGFGRMIRGLSQDFTLAESLGVYSSRLRFATYAIGILLVGFVGIAIGANTALQPYMGLELLILGFIAFLVGGFGHIWGTIVASFVLTIIPQLIIAYSPLSSSWKMLLVFVTAGVFLVFFPRGLAARSYRRC